MSTYTTGELAKLCGVTVRTVQYYDKRGILTPSERSEGGRRLYKDEDLKRLKVICFLRDLDFSIDAILGILKDEHPEHVISMLVEQQEKILTEEITIKKEKLEKLQKLKSGMKNEDQFSLESITDIAMLMEGKKKLKNLHRFMLLTGIPITILQWTSIILGIIKGLWWPFIIWALVAIIWGSWLSRYYFKHVNYICPQCHQAFRPTLKEAFFARHSPKARKLT